MVSSMSPFGSAGLEGLRQRIATLEADGSRPAGPAGWMPLGIAALDHALGGGLAWGSLHEAGGCKAGFEGALASFGLAIAVRAARLRRRPVLAVQQVHAGLEAGWLYGPGLAEAGLPEGTVILVRVRKAEEALLVMEEGLKCAGLSAVLGEIASGMPDALTATRRLSLAAQAGGGLGLLLRPKVDPAPCAAHTRWQVAPAPSRPDACGGLGEARLALTLARNRHGPPGAWHLALRDGLLAEDRPAPSQMREHTHEPSRAPALPRLVAGAPVHGPYRTIGAA